MCRTVLIDNTLCRHRHAEIQKCDDVLKYENKRNNSFWRAIFSPPTKECRRPQRTMTYFKAQLCPDCKRDQERQERRQRQERREGRQGPPPISTQRRNTDNSQPSPLQRRNATRVPDTQRPTPTQQRRPSSSTNVEDPASWRPDRQGRDRQGSQSQRPSSDLNGPLPPLPLQPRRRDSSPPRSSFGPSGQRPRSQSQSRPPQVQSYQQGPQRRASMLQRDSRPPSTGHRPASMQHPRPRPGGRSRVVTHDWDEWSVPSQQSTPAPQPQPLLQVPNLPVELIRGLQQHRANARSRRPTHSSIGRMEEQINSAEQMWTNSGGFSGSRRSSVSGPSGSGGSRGFVNPVPPVPQAYPTSSLTDPRNHRSQREGKYS